MSFSNLLDYSINMWLKFTSVRKILEKILELSWREFWKESKREISRIREKFLENSEESGTLEISREKDCVRSF